MQFVSEIDKSRSSIGRSKYCYQTLSLVGIIIVMNTRVLPIILLKRRWKKKSAMMRLIHIYDIDMNGQT